jgi:hypothetical protein
LVDDFIPFEDGQEALFFQSKNDGLELRDIKLIRTKPAHVVHLRNFPDGKWPELRKKILAGDFQLVPSGVMALEVDGERITPWQ